MMLAMVGALVAMPTGAGASASINS